MAVQVKVLVLALEAALYPTLLAAVLILLAQPRPTRMLAAYLAGGLIISIGAGCLIVFALGGAVSSESDGLSWSADLAAGGLLLLLAVALATRADVRLRERRQARRRKPPPPPEAEDREPWSQRILARGSVPLVFLAGLAINVPGAAYLIALKDIAAADFSTGEAVVWILLFNVIMFLLAEVPLAGLIVAPDTTGARVERLDAWLGRNSRQIAIGVCLVMAAFLIWRGLAES